MQKVYHAIIFTLSLSLSPGDVFLASIPVLYDKVLILAGNMTWQIFKIFVDRQPYLRKRVVNHSENNPEGFSHPVWSDHQPRTPLIVQDERLFTVFDRSVHHDGSIELTKMPHPLVSMYYILIRYHDVINDAHIITTHAHK